MIFKTNIETPMLTKRALGNRLTIAVAVLSLAVLLGGCTHLWSREFLLDESSGETTVEGWRLRPIVLAFKGVAGTEPMSDIFMVSMWLGFPRLEEDKVLDQLLMPQIDSFYFRSPSGDFEGAIRVKTKTWTSHSSTKEVGLVISCRTSKDSLQPGEKFTLQIPREIDTLLMEFNLQFVAGRHWFEGRSSGLWDNFVEEVPRRVVKEVPVTLMLIRKETKTKVPAFMVG